jgi:acetoin utilization deacetylase AcuC-like enzyme
MQPSHPESPERLISIRQRLVETNVYNHLECIEATKVTKEQLQRVHSINYIDWITEKSPITGLHYLDPDTAMNNYSFDAALYAAGAVVNAVDLIMQGKVKNAFCSIRPPGHHAGKNNAAGFCIFNNVAVGVAHALTTYDIRRAAILDFDVHHGNGTEDIFRNDTHVMLCSSFRHPYYPYAGADSSNAYIINTPLPARSDGSAFRQVVNNSWLPALEKFKPEFIFISAGFDAHKDDDMGGLNLDDDDYRWITFFAKDMAARFSSNRIVSSLEGGYDLSSLGHCAAIHIQSLSEQD